MVNQSLVTYIEEGRAKGLHDKEIIAALRVDPAWVRLTEPDMLDAFAFINGNTGKLATYFTNPTARMSLLAKSIIFLGCVILLGLLYFALTRPLPQ